MRNVKLKTKQPKTHDTYLILHNIRSAENVGAIFRTADAVGVSKIYVTGYTPLPIDRFGRKQKKIAKTALGAEETVPWERVSSVSVLIKKLQKGDIAVIAAEQDTQSVNYNKLNITKTTAFLFGNEVRGIAKPLLKKCDAIVEIPMKGKKESLNVSVAVGVLLYRVLAI